MGIWKPDVVLMNLDGFIALIAIIGGTAAPALQTVLRMWESEQTQEVDNIPTEQKHQRELEQQHQTHTMKLESLAQEHEHKIHTLQQSHEHEMCKGDTKKTK